MFFRKERPVNSLKWQSRAEEAECISVQLLTGAWSSLPPFTSLHCRSQCASAQVCSPTEILLTASAEVPRKVSARKGNSSHSNNRQLTEQVETTTAAVTWSSMAPALSCCSVLWHAEMTRKEKSTTSFVVLCHSFSNLCLSQSWKTPAPLQMPTTPRQGWPAESCFPIQKQRRNRHSLCGMGLGLSLGMLELTSVAAVLFISPASLSFFSTSGVTQASHLLPSSCIAMCKYWRWEDSSRL